MGALLLGMDRGRSEAIVVRWRVEMSRKKHGGNPFGVGEEIGKSFFLFRWKQKLAVANQ